MDIILLKLDIICPILELMNSDHLFFKLLLCSIMNIKNLKKIAFAACAVFLAVNMVTAIPDVNSGGVSIGGCNEPSGNFGTYFCRDHTGQVVDVVCKPECGIAESCNGVTMICSSGS